MKKRFLATILAMLVISLALGPAWAATEIRPTGMYTSSGLGVTGDHRLGNTCVVSTGGRTYCGLNASHLSFFADNTVSLELLYQYRKLMDNIVGGYFVRGNADNTLSWAAAAGGSTTTLPWDNITFRPTINGLTLDNAGVLDNVSNYPAGLERTANKSDNVSLGTSTTLYPTQNAVKSYVDTVASGKVGTTSVISAQYGGTGQNSSAATGTPYVSSGTWSFDNVATFMARIWSGSGAYLKYDGTRGDPAGSGTVTEVTGDTMIGVATGTTTPALSLTDNSITAAKLKADSGTPSASTYFRGDNTWATPAGAGDMASGTWDNDANGAIDVAKGGTNATTAAGARTNLGLGTLAVISPTGTPDNTTALYGDNVWRAPAGSGDFSGPANSADNEVVLFSGAGGKTGKRSGITLGADNTLNLPGGLATADPGDGNRWLELLNNTAIAPTASKYGIYFDNGILKDVENGSERIVAMTDNPVFTGSVALPQGANPTVDAAGEVAVDTTADQFAYYGGAARVLSYKMSKDFVIFNDNTSHDNVIRFSFADNATLTGMSCNTGGTDNVTATLYVCDNNVANCSTSGISVAATSTTVTDDTASAGDVPYGAWVKVALTTFQGTSTSLACTVRYVWTRQ